MPKGRIAFERVPVEEVERILKQQNNDEQQAQYLMEVVKHSKRIPQRHSAKNAQKLPSQPKPSIRT